LTCGHTRTASGINTCALRSERTNGTSLGVNYF
jgi:hypothetical protein